MMAERIRNIFGNPTLAILAKEFRQGAINVIKIGCVIRCLREYGVDMTLCVGPSMLPTFNEHGDLVLLEHYSVWADRIKAGDVVVAKSVQTPRYVVCKRVLGIEGDRVKVRPAVGTDLPYYVEVPEGHIWLQGDNALNSTDSRHYGSIPYNLLQGRVFFKVWPLTEAGWVENKIPAFRQTQPSNHS